MSDLILFWHRRDLRIHDNTGLIAARKKTSKVVGVFCLDPQILQRDDIAPVRVTYMIGCLQALQQKYQSLGSQLLILKDDPVAVIPKLAVALQAKAVFWNCDVEPYARKRDLAIIEQLKTENIEFLPDNWDQLLHSPQEIFSGTKTPYTVYTPFWKNWITKPKKAPVDILPNLESLTDEEIKICENIGTINLPTAKDLGFIWDEDLIIQPGEEAANKLLEIFLEKSISNYEQNRNFPAIDGTSQLSPALKFGVISIRKIWQTTREALANSNSEETSKSIETWQKELAWREFFQHAMYHFPELETGPYRATFKNFPWCNNEKHFQAWCAGKTGYPIVDAAMRQLNKTGWMHNRCRMIVASFLTKDLIINPQWGEKYFMQKLIDGDLCANNGGWQWSASSGMDAQPLRIFNPASQTQKFDAEADYIRQWIPELKSVDTEYLISGKIPAWECHKVGYATPIVDHQKQQALFKQIYQQVKMVN